MESSNKAVAISPEQWEIVKALFESAQDVPDEQVSAFLAAKSADPAVRAEVGRLLAEFHEAGTFLSSPPFVSNDQQGQYRWDPLESTCRHASLSIL